MMATLLGFSTSDATIGGFHARRLMLSVKGVPAATSRMHVKLARDSCVAIRVITLYTAFGTGSCLDVKITRSP
jgi:hypothetical protein